eukprot:6197490-Pleurochrysis_carterae.AAC.3
MSSLRPSMSRANCSPWPDTRRDCETEHSNSSVFFSSASMAGLKSTRLTVCLLGSLLPPPNKRSCLMRFAVRLSRSSLSSSLRSSMPCLIMSSSRCAALEFM